MPLNPDSEPSLNPTLLKSISRAAAASFEVSDIRKASFWKDLPTDGNETTEDPRYNPTLFALLSSMFGEKAADNATNELATATKNSRTTMWRELWVIFFSLKSQKSIGQLSRT